MTEQQKCPQCGRPLASDTPGGLCPACLLQRGLESNTIGATAGEKTARWTPPPVEELAGSFPELDILELIGRGGMGAVYKARQKELDRQVALKILPPEIGRQESFAQRFSREAQAMAKLSHPNIVTIHEFGQRGGLYFFLMEYVDGLSLRQVLDSGGVGTTEALAIVPQICDALQYAHDRGVVHRDIKPENILMNRQGQVKIADFGLAKLAGLPPADAAGAPEKVMGTPQYMAPEQVDHPGEVDHRADIYSLGVVFYQMLTGELPAGRLEPPSHKVLIDVRLDEVVLRALAKEPQRRYQQVSQIRTEVETIVTTAGGGQDVHDASQPQRTAGQADDGDGVRAMEHARQAVRAPAIGLLIAAGIGLAVLFALMAVALIRAGSVDGGGGEVRVATAALPLSVFFVGVVVNGIVFFGAMRMMALRSRGMAIAAAILGLVVAPGNIIGLPMGIWALVVLSRRKVIEAFAARRKSEAVLSTPRVLLRWALSILLVIALIGLTVLATSRALLTPKPDVNRTVTRQTQHDEPWQVTLANGIAVELVGVSENPSAGKPWWRPNGELLEKPPFAGMSGRVHPRQGQAAREFAVRLMNLPREDIGTRWVFDPPGSYALGDPMTEGGQAIPGLRAVAAIMPAGRGHITVKYGVAAGRWTTVGSSAPLGASSSSGENANVSFSKAIEKDGVVVVSIAHNVTDRDVRVVAVSNVGKEIRTGGNSSGSAGSIHQITATFADANLQDIKEFRLQARPYAWARFKNISLRPRTKADVRVVVPPRQVAKQPEEAAKDVAKRFLAALRAKDIETMKALSLGAWRGWLTEKQAIDLRANSLPGVFAEALEEGVREIHQKLSSGAMTQMQEIAVQGDLAAVRLSLPESKAGKYLIVVFRSTEQGWRFLYWDDARGPLKNRLSSFADTLNKILAGLPQAIRPTVAPQGRLAFGSVIERVITRSDTDGAGLVFLDIETGRLFQPPRPLRIKARHAHFITLTTRLKDFIELNRIDAVLHLRARDWSMMGLQMRNGRFTGPARYRSVTAGELRAAYAKKYPPSRRSGYVPFAFRTSGYDAGGFWFRTHEGTLGALQYDRAKSGAGSLRLRYRLLAQTAPSLTEPVFGPATRRVIKDTGGEVDLLIDFDTGKLVQPPSEFPAAERAAWLRARGFDAIAAVPQLRAYGMVAVMVEDRHWSELEPAELNKLDRESPQTLQRIYSGGGAYVTYLIKTREGGIGLLRCLSASDDRHPPPFMRVEFKMLRWPPRTVAPPPRGDWRSIQTGPVESGKVVEGTARLWHKLDRDGKAVKIAEIKSIAWRVGEPSEAGKRAGAKASFTGKAVVVALTLADVAYRVHWSIHDKDGVRFGSGTVVFNFPHANRDRPEWKEQTLDLVRPNANRKGPYRYRIRLELWTPKREHPATKPAGGDPAATLAHKPPVGSWQSVDFVFNVDQFVPGKKFWRGSLFLKTFRYTENGTVFHNGAAAARLTCRDGWVTFSGGKARARYFLKTIDRSTYLFLPWLDPLVIIGDRKPAYYVLQKSHEQATQPDKRRSRQRKGSSRVEPYSNVRGKDMRGLNLKRRPDLAATLTFNKHTVWPNLVAMPDRCHPRKIMAAAMNPGLGIRELHRQGITGKGVNVAIIDQPLFRDHPEFAGKIVAYHDVGCGSQTSMHGPAVASLLVGTRCGTAPDARVYYAAVPSWTGDSAFYAKALDWVLKQNAKLKGRNRIKVVSVSAAPSGRGSPFRKNNQAWDKARDRAKAQGVLVLDCTSHRGIIGPCYYDAEDPGNVARCKPGFPGRPRRFFSDKLLVPSSPRTTAEQRRKGEYSYQYTGRGGLSWSIPYCAGVLALGWQLRPDLTAEQMREYLFKSAHVAKDGTKVINPREFIRIVKSSGKRES